MSKYPPRRVNGVSVPLSEAEELERDNLEPPPEDITKAKFQLDMAAIDAEFTLRMQEDVWLVATGKITYAALQANYRAAVGDDTAELPIDLWVAKKQARRDPST